jgi:Cupin domain.
MKFPFEDVVCLNDFIQYRNHQVSSRILVSNETMDMILYALDEEESISMESSTRNKFFLVLDGELKVSTVTNSFLVRTGQSLLIEKGKKHSIEAVDRCKYIQFNL